MKNTNTVKRLSGRLSGAVLALAMVLSLTACPQSEKDRNVAFAKDIAGSLRVALPIIQARNAALAAKLGKAVNAADKLIAAIAASDLTRIAILLRDILPAFTEIASAYSNDATVLAALALAQIGLNFFVNHFLPNGAVGLGGSMSAASSEDVSAVAAFQALPQFGCTYQPARCR